MPNTEESKRVLRNFGYRIRPSSKDFCIALVTNKFEFDGSIILSDVIRDSTWFFSYWDKDPTVRGMLKMLDEIHHQFHEETKETICDYWKKLTCENEISFNFLDLDDYNLTDDLYVKMNARGVVLTPYENFKSWLIECISEDKIAVINTDWTTDIDTTWADLFWEYKDEENMLIDEEFMRFFRNMFQIYYVLDNTSASFDGKSEDDKELRSKSVLLATTKNDRNEYLFIPNDFIRDIKVLTKRNLDDLFSIIGILSDKKFGIDRIERGLENINFFTRPESLFRSFICGNMTYPDKVRFFAMSRFLLKNRDGQFNSDNFESWMRVVRNLIENTTINDMAPFARAIRGINDLSSHCNEILQFLASEDPDISGFSRDQIKEEILKAKLLLKNPSSDVKMAIFNAENANFCKGRISFALYCIDVETDIDALDPLKLNAVTAVMNDYLSEGDISNEFRSALLTIGDNCFYTYWSSWLYAVSGTKYCLIANIDELKNHFAYNINRRQYLIGVIKELLISDLTSYLKRYTCPVDMPAWKCTIIRNPSILKWSQWHYIAVTEDEECYLIPGSRVANSEEGKKRCKKIK